MVEAVRDLAAEITPASPVSPLQAEIFIGEGNDL
jgi:hypothetical protein